MHLHHGTGAERRILALLVILAHRLGRIMFATAFLSLLVTVIAGDKTAREPSLESWDARVMYITTLGRRAYIY